MPIYTLKDRTYEILPHEEPDSKDPDVSPRQLRTLALTLQEYFGCFMLFGMSYKGEPRFLCSSSSGMEHLALKKFAEDVIMGDISIQLSSIGEDGEIEDDDEDDDEEEG